MWIGSIRGTTYSKKHLSLDPDDDDKQYWDFDNSDIAEKDLLAMLGLIHERSMTCQKISIMAVSAGT